MGQTDGNLKFSMMVMESKKGPFLRSKIIGDHNSAIGTSSKLSFWQAATFVDKKQKCLEISSPIA